MVKFKLFVGRITFNIGDTISANLRFGSRTGDRKGNTRVLLPLDLAIMDQLTTSIPLISPVQQRLTALFSTTLGTQFNKLHSLVA